MPTLTKHVGNVIQADHPHKPEWLKKRINSSPGISARHQDLRGAEVVGAIKRSGLATNNNVDLASGN